MSDNLPMVLKGNEFPIVEARTTPFRTIYEEGNIGMSFRYIPFNYRLNISDEEILFDSKNFENLYFHQGQKDFVKKLREHHPYVSSVLLRNGISWQEVRDVVELSYELEKRSIEGIISKLRNINKHSEEFIKFLEKNGKTDLANRLREKPNNL